MSANAPIVVVGAGPVGLAGALALAQNGHTVELVAPDTAPADRRTSALFGRSIDFLKSLGVWNELADGCAPLATMRIIDGTRRLIRSPEVAFPAHEIGRDVFGYNVPNAPLVTALTTRLAQIRVNRRHALVEDVDIASDAVTLSLSTGDTLAARLVIAADGRRSRLRAAAGIATRDWRYDQTALVCNVRHEAPHNDTSIEFHTEHGPFTLVPLPGKRSSLVWIDTPLDSERRAKLAPPVLAEEINERSAFVLGAVTVEGAVQTFPLSGLSVDRFAAGRIVLAGEAAHVFPPIGAQGLNLGYRDVMALAEIIEPGVADPGEQTLLSRYDHARQGDVRARTAGVDVLNRTLLADFLPIQAARSAGLFALARVPAIRQLAMEAGLAASPWDEASAPAVQTS
ncbi:MAG: UbiH/UbiF family hydroxylase [Alphaproteobacteria bacterium]